MIKSPCRSCEKHRRQFPECLEGCEVIGKIQRQLSELDNFLIGYHIVDSASCEMKIMAQ